MLRVKGDLIADLGAAVREAREAEMLTQKELAARLNVSTRTLQGWEAGRLPHPKNRRALQRFLSRQVAA